eukprot:CAMPEP_0184400622 /NCGR_PEP_ID=MMETSP0007-20130409/75588_1 /TAXON_ID=97485 /ORGANISM="Prymnesium parvum, Strain Texoma1" /LENGTH=91 /DNA_ID=CAMNT_0026755637 /DNA_START=243 /DNA_END=515 /DNA_ORIENTATION=+
MRSSFACSDRSRSSLSLRSFSSASSTRCTALASCRMQLSIDASLAAKSVLARSAWRSSAACLVELVDLTRPRKRCCVQGEAELEETSLVID